MTCIEGGTYMKFCARHNLRKIMIFQLLLFCSGIVGAEEANHKRITGSVLLYGKPYLSAVITATNVNNKIVVTAHQFGLGMYEFTNLSSGEYCIKAEQMGVKTTSVMVSLQGDEQEKIINLNVEFEELEIVHPCKRLLGESEADMNEPEQFVSLKKRSSYHPPITLEEKEEFADEIIIYLKTLGITPTSEKDDCEKIILSSCIDMLRELRLVSRIDFFLDYATFHESFVDHHGPLTTPPWDRYPVKYALQSLGVEAAEPILQRLKVAIDREAQEALCVYLFNSLGYETISWLNRHIATEENADSKLRLQDAVKSIEKQKWWYLHKDITPDTQ
jgi:hypothetical protein